MTKVDTRRKQSVCNKQQRYQIDFQRTLHGYTYLKWHDNFRIEEKLLFFIAFGH